MNFAIHFLDLFYCDFNNSPYIFSFPGMKTFQQAKVSVRLTATRYSVIQSPCKHVTLTPEEESLMHLAIMKNRSTKTINNGLDDSNDKLRFQLAYDRADWETLPPIQKKLDQIVLDMSNFISTIEESTHSLSVMSILLSLAGCGTQDVHSDYQIQETHTKIEIPYIVLLPLSPG
jgi:hypothetical protein